LHAMVVDTVTALVSAAEAKDPFLGGHSARVAELAASIGTAMSMNDDDVETVRLAGRLMDVGKIGIRESILNLPRALTPEEFAHVKEHVRISLEILSSIKPIAHTLPAIADHHEHWDGGGYPRGIAGTAISRGGRILGAADAFDALTSRRAWREPLSPADALHHMNERVGILFDPEVFETLKSVVTGRKTLYFLDAEKE